MHFFHEENREECLQNLDPSNEDNSPDFEDFKGFSKNGLRFINLNINSILSKINELR